MRSSHLATALVALTAGLTASAAAHRLAAARRSATASAPVAAPATAPTAEAVAAPAVPAADHDAVVLRFTRPAPAAATAPARCGDSGGLTRAGAPCAARATSGGRCHHHPIAA